VELATFRIVEFAIRLAVELPKSKDVIEPTEIPAELMMKFAVEFPIVIFDGVMTTLVIVFETWMIVELTRPNRVVLPMFMAVEFTTAVPEILKAVLLVKTFGPTATYVEFINELTVELPTKRAEVFRTTLAPVEIVVELILAVEPTTTENEPFTKTFETTVKGAAILTVPPRRLLAVSVKVPRIPETKTLPTVRPPSTELLAVTTLRANLAIILLIAAKASEK